MNLRRTSYVAPKLPQRQWRSKSIWRSGTNIGWSAPSRTRHFLLPNSPIVRPPDVSQGTGKPWVLTTN